MKIKAVIVDDELMARETLRSYVQRYCPEVDLAGEAADVPSAVELIRNIKPDLVFLDVEMPFGNAFDVLEQTSELDFEAIFITAYSDYAIKALNFSAAYYILKPIDIDELVKAVDKVIKSKSEKSDLRPTKVLSDNMRSDIASQRLALPVASGYELIPVRDIVRLEGGGNYTDIYMTDGKKKTVTKVLRFFEEVLEGKGFMRVHKSHIINLENVSGYHKGRGGSVVMSNGHEVEVSPGKKDDLLARIIP